jgi:hypothetical protein
VSNQVNDSLVPYVEAVSREMDALAALVLEEGLSHVAPPNDQSVPWAHDRDVLQRELDTENRFRGFPIPQGGTCLKRPHEAKAIAVLLRARTITGAVGPLVRL